MAVSFLEFWYKALAADIGVEIETDNPERLRQILYRDRTKAMDPNLENLSIILSPTDNSKVWIVKRNGEKT